MFRCFFRAELENMKDRVLMGPTLFERQAKVGGDIFYSCNEQAYLDIPKDY